jgi:hypothetical protein
LAHQPARYTESIGLKVTTEQYETLHRFAESNSKPIAEWCRDTLIATVDPCRPSPVEVGLLAEVTATQAILIDLLCAFGKDGKVTTQKAQEIVDAAHEHKYAEAVELLRLAHSQASKLRLGAAAHSERREKGGHRE